MRIALLLFGFLRSYKHNYQSLKENILDKYNPDIFIHISEDEKRDDRYINDNSNLLEQIKTVMKLYNPISFICEQEIADKSTINSITKYYYKLYQVNSLKKKYERLHNFEYDVVITLRPDISFTTDYDLISSNFDKIKDNFLLYPSSELNRLNNSVETINDHLCIGNSISINVYCKFYKQLNSYIKDSTNKISSETLLYKYINDNKIKYQIDNNIKYKLILSIANSIAISGDSGSGKTTISKLINDTFNETLQLECDRYHKWSRGDPMWKDITHLNPEANYLVKMRKDYFDLKIGNNIYQVDYDHGTGKFTQPTEIEAKQNIILCGLHTLYDKEISDNTNLNIYLDPELNLKIYWKIKRDVEKRGYSVEKVLNNIKKRDIDYNNYIYPQRESADLIINYYPIGEISYDKINESTKIGLKLITKRNCFSKLINYLDNKDVEYINGIEIEKEDIYHFFNIQTPIKDEILYDFIKSKRLTIIKRSSGYKLLIQIFIMLYFI